MLARFENAAAAMNALRRNQERVANNLANANTTGYKRDRFFTEALNERLDAQGAPRSDRRVRQTSDLSPGALEDTGNPLDVALGGEGFFVTRAPDANAPHYTRAGHFVVGNEGTLRTPGGKAVLGEGGPIQVPLNADGDLRIAKDGTITAGGNPVGTLRVVTFDAPEEMDRVQGAAFAAGGAAPEPADAPTVLQGKLETSNVSPITEMTDMIETSRHYQAQQKSLRTTNEVLSRATQTLGRL
jgi:flagellar basal-body rod protein FlgF/flagellar basal-body rod protein FlgG